MSTRDENVPIGEEHPDPDSAESPEPGQGQFQEAYDEADDQVAAVGSIKRDEDPAEEPPTS